jgi:hypothetical protein
VKKTGIVAFLCFSLLWSVAAWGQVPRNEPPFTQAELDKMLADYPGFQAIAEKVSGPQAEPNPNQSMGINQELIDYLRDKGWNPPERFLYVMAQAFMGVANLTMGQMGGLDQLMAQRKAIESMPMDAEEKKKTLADMDLAIEEMKKVQGVDEEEAISPEEMALIEKNKDKILAVQGVK